MPFKVCRQSVYGYACLNPKFIAPLFMSGALVYLTTPLAQHVFMDGTSLERKREVWIAGEDMQLANMVYSDPAMTPFVINHQKVRSTNKANFSQ